MKASIIIPTHNRGDVLLLCLEAISQLEADPSSFEIIVVDNASTDHTKDACTAFIDSHPNLFIRYIFEGTQGVSYARNRGVKESQGEFICLLDDDSPPFPKWLDILLSPFSDPTVGCTGGPSIPNFQGQEVPDWLLGDLQGLLSGYGLPYSEPTPVSRWENYPLSCNMAIRRTLFDDLGYFRTDLDRIGNRALAAGDTEMVDRIYKANWKVMYVPDAPVNHFVPPARLNKTYIYRIGRGLAESHIILTANRNPLQILRWFASDTWYALRMFLRFILALIKRSPLWFDDYMRFWMVEMRIPIRIKYIWRDFSSNSFNK
jgi:glucosyl-dolichyl phosphate glucuronosyltransferase